MGTENTSAGSRPEHRGLPYWMDRTLKELEKVRAAPEADAVHDTRVAMRRCRSVAAVMEEVDPDATWREMRKLARKPFRQLGALRDTQVLEEWTKKLAAEGDAVRRRLLEEFEKQEAEQRDAALKAAGRFDEKAWRRCERALRRRARLVPVDSPTAECLALERLEETKQAHAQALRSDKPEPWHALRISVKRFRYTVESLLPGRYEEWAEGLKRLQDLLGEVHDLDVLRQAVERLASGEAEESRAAFEQRIDGERRERLDTYRQLTLGKASLWQHWRAGLPHGEHLDAAAWARLRATCRATDQDAARTSQISRLTMRLFDALGRADAGAVFERHELRRVM
ncbi:MAG TPA: CHAD domain-containing protein, partial [Candidatus Acidoferrum sp.]